MKLSQLATPCKFYIFEKQFTHRQRYVRARGSQTGKSPIQPNPTRVRKMRSHAACTSEGRPAFTGSSKYDTTRMVPTSSGAAGSAARVGPFSQGGAQRDVVASAVA